jgi:acyl-CoA synthetase (AMP-forming)/AMP-acid ligase II
VPDDPSTLPELLQEAARRHPGRSIGIYDRQGRAVERRAYPEVLASARQAASRLAALGLSRGDRLLVCLPTSWEWMESWLGALLLGALPAAVAPAGSVGSFDSYAGRVGALMERIGARRLVAAAALRDDLQRGGRTELAAATITPETLSTVAADPGFEPVVVEPHELAFLQFTSGSSGLPRAVMIPHRAAIHNNLASDEAIGAPFGARASAWAESMVAWLPMNHDMGLVGCLLMSLTHGLDLSLLRPTTFLARPRIWLDRLSGAGATFAPAPNFGYQLCVERIAPDELAGIDLSGWRSALTGAEMVRPETVAAFQELTARSGFRPESFCPCYGLAEGTLAVTFDRAGRGARTLPPPAGASGRDAPKEVVCVGSPVLDTELRITAPDGTGLAEDTIGEVHVKGPGIFAGYYNDAEATREGLRDGWLCTGDLGFLHDGELYLTGRVKDLLIIHGNNIMPHELEWLAESVVGGGGSLRSGAFSIDAGAQGEQAVLVVETTERAPERLATMGREIRLRVARAMSLPLADLVFVKRGHIPKTTSGKVRRGHLRRSYGEGELERLDS